MWIGKLAELADVFSRLNGLNSSLQRYYINKFTVCNKTVALKKKLNFCIAFAKNQRLIVYKLARFCGKFSVDIKKLFAILSQHLKELVINFCQYFSKN